MIDLHTHSRCSDGSDTPTEVIDKAAAAGCSAIALTDHDGLAGLEEAATRARELGIEFVPGCEVSVAFDPGSLHILCYFVSEEGSLAAKLGDLRDERERRNSRLLDTLDGIGITIAPEEVREVAGSEVIGRPHVAEVLMRHGYVTSISEAFDRYLGKGAPAYVAREHVDPREIVDLAQRSGALTAIAHPMSMGLYGSALERQVGAFAEMGVTGLESYYSTYDAETRRALVELARKYDMVPTGGSDYHGSYKPGLFVGSGNGDLNVPDASLEELLDRKKP
jgi:hypothetical protein